MKILGIGDNTVHGKVLSISRDGVVFEQKKKRVVYTLKMVEQMISNKGA